MPYRKLLITASCCGTLSAYSMGFGAATARKGLSDWAQLDLSEVEIEVAECYKRKDFPLSRCFLAEPCTSKGCKATVPAALAGEHMCILHFTLFIEQECAEMRRESNLGKVAHERQQEFMKKIADRGTVLVNTATSGFAMSDEIKARVLSTLLTLMTCRENIDRAAMRQSALRRFVG